MSLVLRFPLLALVAGLFACSQEQKTPAPVAKALPPRYGLDINHLRVLDTTVPSGFSLGSFLPRFGYSPGQIHRIDSVCKSTFDVRNIQAGRPLILFRDSVGQLRHIVYEPSAIEWIRFDLDSTPEIVRQARRIDTLDRAVAGIIETSLWDALTKAEHPPALVDRVADILAWNVDFFSIQPQDEFRILYQEFQVEGKPYGLGNVQAVWFSASGEKTQVIRFGQDGIYGYYDSLGQPTRRMFLKAPLQYSRISSSFSHSRYHPVLRISRPHHGVDYAAPTGTPVATIGDGTVTVRGWDPKGGGNYVKIRHARGYSTTYMHLHSFAGNLRNGQKVSQGDLIGFVGSTGLSTGPHLDFRVHLNGTPINPLHIQSPPAPPLDKHILPEFQKQYRALDSLLHAIPLKRTPPPA